MFKQLIKMKKKNVNLMSTVLRERNVSINYEIK